MRGSTEPFGMVSVVVGMMCWFVRCSAGVAAMLAVMPPMMLAVMSLAFAPWRTIHRRLVIFVEFVGQTWICIILMTSSLFRKRLGPLLPQMFLQHNSISCVTLVHRVCKIPHEGHETDGKINDDIDQHHHSEACREPPIDLFARIYHHHRKRSINSITGTNQDHN